MAELVDALDSGSSRGNSVDVRVILAAIFNLNRTMMHDSIALIANGNIDNYSIIASKIGAHSRIIAVDGGLNHCLHMGISPEVIIGDLDSTTEKTLAYYAGVKILDFPREKDYTDLELALDYVCMEEQSKVVVYGALGGRLDHTLYNLNLLCRYPGRLYFETENEVVFALDNKTVIPCFVGQTISLLPLGSVQDVTTRGLKWELHSQVFDKSFMSVSNICLNNSFEVQFSSGQLLCCLQLSLNENRSDLRYEK